MLRKSKKQNNGNIKKITNINNLQYKKNIIYSNYKNNIGVKPASNLRMMAQSSFFTVLIIVGGFLSFPVPFSPVPIVFSDFFSILSGMFLGPAWGSASVGLYLFLGTLGFPVFAGGKAGFAVLFSPTGGFLLGFLAGSCVAGLLNKNNIKSISKIKKNNPVHQKGIIVIKEFFALFAGNAVLYCLGILWLQFILKVTWKEAFAFGLLPFIPAAIIKIIASILLIQAIQPFLKNITVISSQH